MTDWVVPGDVVQPEGGAKIVGETHLTGESTGRDEGVRALSGALASTGDTVLGGLVSDLSSFGIHSRAERRARAEAAVESACETVVGFLGTGFTVDQISLVGDPKSLTLNPDGTLNYRSVFAVENSGATTYLSVGSAVELRKPGESHDGLRVVGGDVRWVPNPEVKHKFGMPVANMDAVPEAQAAFEAKSAARDASKARTAALFEVLGKGLERSWPGAGFKAD